MNDLDRRFREADSMDATDLWPDASTRRPCPLPPEPPRHRALAFAVAVVVAAGSVAVTALALGHRSGPVVPGSPRPSVSPHRALATAGDLADAMEAATGQCLDQSVPFGDLEVATQHIQCTFQGTTLVLLSFEPPSKPEDQEAGLRDRAVVLGPTWLVIADDAAVAQGVQKVVGGQVLLTPANVEPTVRIVPWCKPWMDCPYIPPTMPMAIHYRLRFVNPLGVEARVTCFAKGLPIPGGTLIRGLFHDGHLFGGRLPAHAIGTIDRTTGPLPVDSVGQIVAGCTAWPVDPLVT